MKKTWLLAVGMLILAVVGWWAVARGPATTAPEGTRAAAAVSVPGPPGASPTPTNRPPKEPGPDAPPAVAQLPVTGEAEVYAAAIAAVVFGMDTRDHDPQAYRALLLGQADPRLTPTGFADLERLLAERIPTDQQWARMRENDQWSQFEAGEVWEPGSWTQVVIAGDAEPGWVVRNVTGVQTTHYTEDGADREAVRERSVTIAMRCPAPGAGVDSCRLVLIGGSVLP